MTDTNDLELNLEDQDINRTEERITKLSSKVKETATQRDEAKAAAEAAEAARIAAEKERDFFKDFSGITTKYQGAADYQDKILEKVKSGYSVEDATVSVLNAEGKFTPAAPQVQQYSGSAAGGSATAFPTQTGTKSVEEMTREDKRAALMEADKRGELAEALKRF